METERSFEKEPGLSELSISSPAIESFFDPSRIAEVWPSEVTANEAFQQEVEKRKELNAILDDVLSHVPQPTMTIEEAINRKQISKEQAEKMYTSLSDLLGDKDYRRLILYLPFEFLPDRSWQPSGEDLGQATERFRDTYLTAWRSLLTTHDVRANFVDGDVLEVEQRDTDLPRVVKAAHLIPELIRHRFMEVSEVITLIEDSDDQLLKNSIAETLPVLADLGLITEKEIDLMRASTDLQVNNIVDALTSDAEESQQTVTTPEEITFSSIQDKLNRAIADIKSENYGDITKKRKDWLVETKTQAMVDKLAQNVSTAIVNNSFNSEKAIAFLSEEVDSSCKQVLIEGIRKAIESIAPENFDHSQEIYLTFRNALVKLWKSEDSTIKNSLSKTFRRLHHLGIIDDKEITELGVTPPRLENSFAENIKLIGDEVHGIQEMIRSAETKPELSSLIFPAALVYGSRLKGYGEQDADVDIALFVKPGTSLTEQPRIKELAPEAIEFWLDTEKDELIIHDFPSYTDRFGKSYWVHVLFESAWVGNKETIRELHEKLLVPYMRETDATIHGLNARKLYLEEMERDILQYRLMHKGYERFSPQFGGIKTQHSNKIDGNSMFWDSGYRRTATKLFASKVFLPKLPKL